MVKSEDKKFKIPGDKILDIAPNRGGCIATDKITVDGCPVGYMYRDESYNNLDNGWRFFAGDEDQDYINNHENSSIYDTNTIVNYDIAILPYLDLPVGTKLERNADDTFSIVD